MKLKIFQTCGDCHQVAIAVKCAIMVMLLFCTISIAGATGEPDPKPTVTPEDTGATIPAVPLDKINEEIVKMLGGWLKQIVLAVMLFGGICYSISKSEDAKATGISYVKNAVLAIVMVMVGTWFVNWLYTL